jgi:hypothetical protein
MAKGDWGGPFSSAFCDSAHLGAGSYLRFSGGKGDPSLFLIGSVSERFGIRKVQCLLGSESHRFSI